MTTRENGSENAHPDTDVVVIGGGCAGLAAAVALCDAGLHVTLLEREAALGGRARSVRDSFSGDIIDVAPNILLSGNRNLLQLLERLGTQTCIAWHDDEFITVACGSHTERVYPGVLQTLLRGVRGAVRSPSMSLNDIYRSHRIMKLAIKAGQRDARQLDGIGAREMLIRFGVSEQFINAYWRTIALTVMNAPLEQCSGAGLLSGVRTMTGHDDCRIGFPAVSLAELVVQPAANLVTQRGGRILLDSAVTSIEGEHSRFSKIRLEDGSTLRARACVVAVPPQLLTSLLPEGWQSRYRQFRETVTFRSTPAVSTYLWFARRLSNEMFWVRAWSEKNLNFGFFDLSNVRAAWSARPSVIVGTMARGEDAANLSDAQIVEATGEELRSWLPAADQNELLHACVLRVPTTVPIPLPGSEQLRPQVRTPVPGLFLAGDWIGTGLPPSIESAVCAGNRAAERVTEFLGDRIHVALPVRQNNGVSGAAQRWLQQ